MLEVVHRQSILRPDEADAYREALHMGAYIMDRELPDLEQYAEHYDNFNVTAVGVFEKDNGQTGRVGAANRNHHKGENDTKLCAEQLMLRMAKHAGYSACRVIYLRGPWQPDTQTGIRTETLCSCGNCRGHMRENPMMDDETVMVNVRPDSSVREVVSFGNLVAYFNREEGAEAPIAREDPEHILWNSARTVYDVSQSRYRPKWAAEMGRSEIFIQAVNGQLGVQDLGELSPAF